MFTSNYFIVHQVTLLGVSYHCAKEKNPSPVPTNTSLKIPADWIPYPAPDY